MIDKKEVIDLLNSMINDENRDKIEKYIEKISKVDEMQWKTLLESKRIETLQDAQRFVTNAMESQTSDKFINLNELISYGCSNSTVHLHVIPKDVRNLLSKNGLEKAEYLLIDALEKVQVMLQEDDKLKNMKQVYAVSGLIRRPISTLFENLDFDVKIMKSKLAENDVELAKFYEMFKDKKYIGRAVLQKEKLLSDEWNMRKEQRKEQLLANNKELNIESEEVENSKFKEDLQQVYSQDAVVINADKREEVEKEIDYKEKNMII